MENVETTIYISKNDVHCGNTDIVKKTNILNEISNIFPHANTTWLQWHRHILAFKVQIPYGKSQHRLLLRRTSLRSATLRHETSPTSGRQNQRPIVPDEWHNHTGRVAVTVDLSDGRVAIIEQNTKQSNYLKLRISHTPDIISESWKLLWREQVISHM